MEIGKIRHKGLKRLYEDDDSSLPPAISVLKIKRILSALEFATSLAQIESVPGWKLHPLKGSRKGEYSISVTGNWRITFRLEGSTVTNVNFEDYH